MAIRSAASKVMWVGRAKVLAFGMAAVVAVLLFGLLMAASPAHAVTFTVNSTAGGADIALNGICDTDPRITRVVCTLRAAIQEANNEIQNPDRDTINFDIPATDPNCNAKTGVCTTSPGTATFEPLPRITDPVMINGYTQRPCSTNPAPCSRPNTNAVGTNAVLLIQLNGANSGSAVGLEIAASNSVVKGLVINRFIGGIATRVTSEVDPTGNRIEGNFIGTNPAGTTDLGNLINGVHIQAFFDVTNTVGGTSRAARNLISGNNQNGVGGFGSGTKVLGNLIGTDRTGTKPLGNDTGVWFTEDNNTVGGDTAASANVIAFNSEDGVRLFNRTTDPTGIGILGNSIFSNGDLGIDLGDDGRTANDLGDADEGANNLQNFPVVTSATKAGSITIKGLLNSTPSTPFVVRFFSNPSNDNEGRRFLGKMNVITNASGNTGTFSFSANGVALGQRITATATDPNGNTSEFSAPRAVSSP